LYALLCRKRQELKNDEESGARQEEQIVEGKKTPLLDSLLVQNIENISAAANKSAVAGGRRRHGREPSMRYQTINGLHIRTPLDRGQIHALGDFPARTQISPVFPPIRDI